MQVQRLLTPNKSVKVVRFGVGKAFYRVSYRRPVNKIKSHGITDRILLRFTSCILSRNQVVKANGFTTHHRPVTSGMIQNSVLGSLLFLLHVNDVLNVAINGVPFLFTDDVQIVYTF